MKSVMKTEILAVFVLVVSSSYAFVDLYLEKDEVIKLIGISAQLFYIRNGVVNEHASKYPIQVPNSIFDITQKWQSLAGKELPYTINVYSTDMRVLNPTLNIPQIGKLSTELSHFIISMKCSGTGEVEVLINIKFHLNQIINNTTEIVLKRKKTCLNTLPPLSFTQKSAESQAEAPLNGMMVLSIGIAVAVGLILNIFIIAACSMKKSNKANAKKVISLSNPLLPVEEQRVVPAMVSDAAEPSREPEELHRRISELQVQRCRVRLSNLLQEGNFGKVYNGTYNDTEHVLVKTVGQQTTGQQVSLLLQEGMSLYGASHVGILSVLGVSIEDHNAPLLLYPVASDNTRNLKLFLHDPVARSLTTLNIVRMSLQVAQALDHLHSHNVIHKDVATRNCVIDDQLRIKLADNSLARDLFPADYSCLGDCENRPIKWMALETIQKRKFTEASDSWGFGVFMWELMTLAKQPYEEVDPFEMEHYLSDGFRLSQPVNCPDELFAICAYCWALSELERPTFAQLEICVQEFYNQLTKYV